MNHGGGFLNIEVACTKVSKQTFIVHEESVHIRDRSLNRRRNKLKKLRKGRRNCSDRIGGVGIGYYGLGGHVDIREVRSYVFQGSLLHRGQTH